MNETNTNQSPMKIGEYELQPLTLGTITTLSKIGSAFAAENPEGTPLPVSLEEIAVAALVFARPVWCSGLIKSGKKNEILSAAEDLSFLIDAPTMQRVMDYINTSLAEFFAQSKPMTVPAPASKD